MLRTLMKSKLHRATVTDANLHYLGSVTLDPLLMEAADLVEHERVQVLDLDNGARFETYVIAGDRGGGQVCLNGAAARLVHPGDKVIIISYASYSDEEVREHRPTVVLCDQANRPRRAGPESPETTWDEIGVGGGALG
ncbi:MAG TPA: aspartate 1-decarboxylase [Egibacteraceae bacterium]|nr:aspartate 1-decarboxylase [Egibacteraceae bacterium]